jgi:hypothetical protein
VDIEKNVDLRFKNNPELKKQLAELIDLRGRMEKTLAREVKTVQELRLGDSGHGIEGKIPGYTKDYHLEEFRK